MEAQQAKIKELQETIVVLAQELEEERAEGTRKDAETGEWRDLVGKREIVCVCGSVCGRVRKRGSV